MGIITDEQRQTEDLELQRRQRNAALDHEYQRQQARECEEAILNVIRTQGLDGCELVVQVGAHAVSTQLDSMITLLESEPDPGRKPEQDPDGDGGKLLKTMRVCREMLLSIYEDVRGREIVCTNSCGCHWERDGNHFHWPSYAAGCYMQLTWPDCCRGLGGRLWDVVEFLKQHHGDYKNSRSVAAVLLGALRTLRDEFRSKEGDLSKVLRKANVQF